MMKLQHRELARQAASKHDIHGTHLRLHNTIGPGQGETLVAGAMSRKLLNAIKQREPVLRVKNCHAVRDWMDVRDMSRMLITLAQISDHLDGELPIKVCTGIGRSVLDLAKAMILASGTSIEVMAACDGKSEAAQQKASAVIGIPTLLKKLIGQASTPRITFEQSTADTWHALSAAQGKNS
jgi:nucleoside-diphosphate-sugar epimerase